MAEPVLVVEDDAQVRRTLRRILDQNGYEPLLASSAADARACLQATPVPLMLCDVNLPDESGLELVREVVERHPHVAPVVVSALDDHELAETALDLGAYDYVTKPFTSTDLLITISNALRRRAREYKLQFRQEALEEAIDRHRAAFEEARERLEESVRELRFSQEDTVHRLFRALRVRHGETAGHLARVSAYCALIAERIGFAPERVERIRVASMLHDVGKIAVPDRILEKPGTLSGEERAVVERHAIVGHELLAGSRFEVLDLAATIAYTHHERFDGTGYPRGLEGEQTPVEGRIAAVADVFDAVTYDRAYRRAMSVEVAVETMRAERGRHFDPVVLDAFLESPRAIAEIMERSRDADDEDLEELAQIWPLPGD